MTDQSIIASAQARLQAARAELVAVARARFLERLLPGGVVGK